VPTRPLGTREFKFVSITAHEKHMQIVGNSKIYFALLIYFYHHIVAPRCVAARACAKQAAWDWRVQIYIENCIPETPLNRQLVQIIGRNKFSIRFESLCWILRVSSRTRMSQNQPKSNYKDCSFGKRDSFVKGTGLRVLIFAKSHAGRKFEALEAACLVSIYTFLEYVRLQVSKTAFRSFKSTNQAHNNIH